MDLEGITLSEMSRTEKDRQREMLLRVDCRGPGRGGGGGVFVEGHTLSGVRRAGPEDLNVQPGDDSPPHCTGRRKLPTVNLRSSLHTHPNSDCGR